MFSILVCPLVILAAADKSVAADLADLPALPASMDRVDLNLFARVLGSELLFDQLDASDQVVQANEGDKLLTEIDKFASHLVGNGKEFESRANHEDKSYGLSSQLLGHVAKAVVHITRHRVSSSATDLNTASKHLDEVYFVLRRIEQNPAVKAIVADKYGYVYRDQRLVFLPRALVFTTLSRAHVNNERRDLSEATLKYVDSALLQIRYEPPDELWAHMALVRAYEATARRFLVLRGPEWKGSAVASIESGKAVLQGLKEEDKQNSIQGRVEKLGALVNAGGTEKVDEKKLRQEFRGYFDFTEVDANKNGTVDPDEVSTLEQRVAALKDRLDEVEVAIR